MNVRVLLSALVLATSVATFTPSPAAAGEPSTRDLLQQAQIFVNKASQLYLQADYEGALAQLRQAELLALTAKDPSLANIRFNIARCFEQMKRWPEALEAYEIYNGVPDEPHRKQKAWAAMQTLKTKVFGALSVSCFPAGAHVEIAGVTNGVVGCPWQSTKVVPGEYSVLVRNPGYEDQTQSVMVVAGQAVNAEASLKPLAAPAPAQPVMIAVEPQSKTPILPWLSIGAGAAAVGVGGVFTGLALSDRDEAEDLAPGEARQDAVSGFEGSRTMSYIMYGTGGLLAAAGIAMLYLTGMDETEPDSVSLMPTANGLRVEF